MSIRNLLLTTSLTMICLAGCGGTDDAATDAAVTTDGRVTDMAHSTDTGVTTDTGVVADSGSDTGTSMDSGTDPCAGDATSAMTLAGCNGPAPGAGAAANAINGTCTPDGTNGHATCTSTDARCYGDTGELGLCLQACTPAETYSSTSNCPTGSRCFTLSSGAWCFPDCASGADCTTGFCDGDSSCGAAAADTDAGLPALVETVSCASPFLHAATVSASVIGGFSANVVTVEPGSIVEFDNSDVFGHTVSARTSESGEPVASDLFNEPLPALGSVCLRFNTEGTFPYYCNIHTSMRGVVQVGSP